MLQLAYLVANRMMRRVFGHSQSFALPLSLSLSHFVQKGELVLKKKRKEKDKPVTPFFIVALWHVYTSSIRCGFLCLVDGHCHHCLVFLLIPLTLHLLLFS